MFNRLNATSLDAQNANSTHGDIPNTISFAEDEADLSSLSSIESAYNNDNIPKAMSQFPLMPAQHANPSHHHSSAMMPITLPRKGDKAYTHSLHNTYTSEAMGQFPLNQNQNETPYYSARDTDLIKLPPKNHQIIGDILVRSLFISYEQASELGSYNR